MGANSPFLVLIALRNAVNIIYLGRGFVKNEPIKKIIKNNKLQSRKLFFFLLHETLSLNNQTSSFE